MNYRVTWLAFQLRIRQRAYSRMVIALPRLELGRDTAYEAAALSIMLESV